MNIYGGKFKLKFTPNLTLNDRKNEYFESK